MADKPKYDLSNVGGQPKGWLDRSREPSELGAKEYGLLWLLLAAAAITVGALLWGGYRLFLA